MIRYSRLPASVFLPKTPTSGTRTVGIERLSNGSNTKDKKRVFSLVHYDSIDGIDWQPAKHHEISDRTITWDDGTTEQLDHLERPQVIVENGKPIALDVCRRPHRRKQGPALLQYPDTVDRHPRLNNCQPTPASSMRAPMTCLRVLRKNAAAVEESHSETLLLFCLQLCSPRLQFFLRILRRRSGRMSS